MSDVIETDRPGWSNIVGFTRYLVGQASDPPDRRELRPPAVADGRLRLLVDDPPPQVRGFLAAAEALSAETCERCGGKDPDGNNLAASQACQAAKERLRLDEVGKSISITVLTARGRSLFAELACSGSLAMSD